MKNNNSFLLFLLFVNCILAQLIIPFGIFNFIILTSLTICFLYFIYKQIVSCANNKKLILYLFYLFFLLGLILNFWINAVSISKGSNNLPYMPGDGLSYFLLAKEISTSNTNLTDISLNYVGYPLALSWVFKVFGPHLIYGLLLNLFVLTLNVLLTAKSAFLVFNEKKVFDFSFLILLGISQFLATGFMLLKDGFIVLSIVLAFYAGAYYYKKNKLVNSLALLLISIIIMGLFRFTFIFFPVLVFLLLALEKTKSRSQVFILLVPVLIVGFDVASELALKEHSVEKSLDFATSNTVISRRLEGDSGLVSRVLSGYNNWSIVKKAAFLPITSGIQYMMPFDVYNFLPALSFPYYFISKNYQIIWLAYIGPLFLFSCYLALKKKHLFEAIHLKLFYLGVLLCLIPAFIYGGAIPRYAVPFFPVLIPFMAQVYLLKKRDQGLNKKWKNFLAFLYIFFVLLLFFYVALKFL